MKIFVDLDGVLADLLGSLTRAWEKEPEGSWGGVFPYAEEARATGPDEAFELWLRDSRRWDAGPVTRPEFWATLTPFSWTPRLLRKLRVVAAPDRLYVCSNPGRAAFAAAAAAGKMSWATAYGFSSRDIVLTAAKELLAGADRVLIDDDERNIRRWREAGGLGILFPQPWNSAAPAAPDPVEYVATAVAAALRGGEGK